MISIFNQPHRLTANYEYVGQWEEVDEMTRRHDQTQIKELTSYSMLYFSGHVYGLDSLWLHIP